MQQFLANGCFIPAVHASAVAHALAMVQLLLVWTACQDRDS